MDSLGNGGLNRNHCKVQNLLYNIYLFSELKLIREEQEKLKEHHTQAMRSLMQWMVKNISTPLASLLSSPRRETDSFQRMNSKKELQAYEERLASDESLQRGLSRLFSTDARGSSVSDTTYRACRRLAPDHVWSAFNIKGQNRSSKKPGVETTLVTIYKLLLSHVHKTHSGDKPQLTKEFKTAMGSFLKNSLRKKVDGKHEEQEGRAEDEGAVSR